MLTALRAFGNDLLSAALREKPQRLTVAEVSPLIPALDLLGLSRKSEYQGQAQTSPFKPLEKGRIERQSDIGKIKDEEKREELRKKWPKLPTIEGHTDFPAATLPAVVVSFGLGIAT